MLVDTWSISFVIRPESVIDITVNVNEASLAMCSVLPPLSGILGAIGPLLFTEAVSEAAFPFAGIYCTSLELVRLSLLARLIRIVQSFRHCFTSFFHREVFA